MSQKRILIIDDEKSMRHMLRLVLTKAGYTIFEAENGLIGLDLLKEERIDIVLCDIRMPEMDGMEFLKKVMEYHNVPNIIMMSAYGTMDTAIECMKLGAYDYISKPFKPDEILLTIRKAEERQRLQEENRYLRNKIKDGLDERKIIYESKAMADVMKLVTKVAETNSPVLITGDTGTGKELVARAIHQSSSRQKNPFIAVNCTAIAPTLIESELFGHVRGAFTGANRDNPGLFAAADKGTILLDEVGDLPSDIQPKLLRVLQENEILPVGGTKARKVDVRILAATARDLREEVREGRFRDDLFYRLAVVDIHVPPLRERTEDIVLLIDYLIKKIAARDQKPPPFLTEEARKALVEYEWPGNVRELENYIEKAMIFSRGGTIDDRVLPGEARRKNRDSFEELSLKKAIARIEKEYILKALDVTAGNKTKAAELLEISLRSLMYKIKDLNI